MAGKKSSNYAWVIFAACCCYCAGTITLTMSIAGVFLPALSQHSGLNIAQTAMWLAVMGPVSTVITPVWAWLIDKVNIRILTIVLALFQGIACIVFANAYDLFMLVIAGICVGLSLSYMYGMVPATLMGNWFDERVRGRFMGVCFAFTGVGTFIFAPLFANLIITIGLSNAYYVAAGLSFVICIPITFFIYLKPEDIGALPYGYVEGASNDNTKDLAGISFFDSLKNYGFYMFIFIYIGVTCLTGFNSMMPDFANEFLAGTMSPEDLTMFGASMVSISAVGNIISKLIFGWMSDRFGIMKTMFIFYTLITLTFVIWYIWSTPLAMEIGAFLLGFSNAVVSVGMVILTQEVYGLKDFPKIYAWTGIWCQFINGSAATVIGIIGLNTGSYKNAMFLGIGLMLISYIGTIALIPCMKKLRARWDTTVAVEQGAEPLPEDTEKSA